MREPFSKASTYLTVLFILQAMIGVATIMAPAVYEYVLSSYMDTTSRQMLGAILWGTYIFAFQLVIAYVASVAIWKRLWTRAYSPNLKYFLRSWLAFGFVVHLCGLAMVWSVFSSADAVVLAQENSLWRGINLYYTCPEWKLLWDGMQYHKECCGVTSYADWMRASWMPNTTTIDCASPGQGAVYKKNILAPYACCKHDCPDCYQTYSPRSVSASIAGIPTLSLSQINQAGCLQLFADNLFAMLYTQLALMVVAMKFYLIIWYIVRKTMKRQPEPTSEDRAFNAKNYTDEDGRSIIVVKCPPNVKCIVGEEHEVASQSDFPRKEQMDEYYTVKQEVLHPAQKMRILDSQATCGCSLNAHPSKIFH